MGLLVAVASLATAEVAEASHFRYGHLTWAPAGGNAVEFKLTGAFRRNGYSGTAGDGDPAVGDIITETIGATRLRFGDGNQTATLRFKVVSIDPTNNWLLADALEPGSSTKTTISHTYAAPNNAGAPWLAEINSCCRTGVELNNPNGQYQVSAEVDLSIPGVSPVSSLPPIINLTCNNALASFVVPASDPDPNTQLRFRLASPSEAGSGFDQPGPPSAANALSIDPNTGVVSWDTNGATCNGLYSCQVIIEDLDATTGAQRNRVAVDFLISLVDCPPGNSPPAFQDTPCGQTLVVSAGNEVTFGVEAADADPGNVTLNSAGLPAGATSTTALPAAGNPVGTTISWTPGVGDVGDYVITFSATDDCGAQALCSVTIRVIDTVTGNLDMHPTSCPNPLNTKAQGLTPAALLGTDEFDIGQVDQSTLLLEGVAPERVALGDVSTPPAPNGPEACPCTTEGGDGWDDLVLKFRTQDLVAALGAVVDGEYREVTLTGQLLDGTPFEATDCIRILAKDSTGPLKNPRVELSVSRPSGLGSEAEITYAVSQAMSVKLTVVDVSGRVVSRLVDNEVSAGIHRYTWRPSNLPSGMYFVRLTGADQSAVRSIPIMR